jgi:hypothetical protein
MTRPIGGYIGFNRVPTLSAASGVWTLREQERFRRAATWPVTFTPASLPGLNLWLDASDASTLYDATTGGSLVAANGEVARWEDKSGQSNHVTQSSSSLRPILKSAQINSLDAIQFDGSNDILTTNATVTGSQSRTVIVVAKRTNNTDIGTVATFGNTGNAGGENRWLCRYGTSANPHVGGDGRATNQNLSAGVQAAWTDAHISCWSQNSGTRNLTYLLNNSSLSITGNPPAAQSVFSGLTIGAFVVTTPTQHFLGLIGELIVCNQELSPADRETAIDYLATKWGITL